MCGSDRNEQQKNGAGRDAFDESMWAGEGREEVSGWIEGYLGKLTGDEGFEEPEQATSSEDKPEIKEEEVEDVLLSCRYGDLEDVQAFVEKFGDEPLKSARDDRGNNVIHMCCGNGHTGKSRTLLQK